VLLRKNGAFLEHPKNQTLWPARSFRFGERTKIWRSWTLPIFNRVAAIKAENKHFVGFISSVATTNIPDALLLRKPLFAFSRRRVTWNEIT